MIQVCGFVLLLAPVELGMRAKVVETASMQMRVSVVDVVSLAGLKE